MSKPVHTKYAPTKRTLTGALAPEAPRWLVPLIILIVILIIVAIAVGSLPKLPAAAPGRRRREDH